jgi:hypothetical protein
MFAFRSCPSALLAGHSGPVPPATRIPQSATSASLDAQALHFSSAPGAERISSPVHFQQVTLSLSRFQYSNHRLFNHFSTLLYTRKKLTHCFSVTSTLLLRSFAQERKSTPLLSGACALFCENLRGYPFRAEEKYEVFPSIRRGRKARSTQDLSPPKRWRRRKD